MKILGGRFKNHPLKTLKGPHTRPTTAKVRESLFNICQHVVPGANVLDLFAGSGAMGLEALSRGAAHVTFIEKNRHACQIIKDNIASLHCEETTVYCDDLFHLLNTLPQYDLIFADPPYAKTQLATKLLEKVDQHLKPNGLFFLEQSSANLVIEGGNMELDKVYPYGNTYLYKFSQKS